MLVLDGVRVPDTPPDAYNGPVALADLSVRWGRESSDQQPDPSTCAFAVWDRDPGSAELSALVHAGADVSVLAYGDRYYTYQQWTADPVTGWPTYAPDSPDPHGHVWPLYGMAASVVQYSFREVHAHADNPSVVQTLVLGQRAFGVNGPYLNVPAFAVWPRMNVVFTVGQYTLPVGLRYQIRLFSYDVETGVLTPTAAVSPVKTAVGSVNESLSNTFLPAAYAGITGRPAAGLEILTYATTKWTDVVGAWSAQGTTRWNQYPSGIVDFSIRGFLFNTGGSSTPIGPAPYYTNVFQGRVTDVELTPDGLGSVVAKATAVDVQAEYAHRYIGDQPWLSESSANRSNRIADLASIPRPTVPAPASTWPVSWRDVDSHSSVELLKGLADTINCNLWLRTGWDGQSLFYENPSLRTALLQLSYDGFHVIISQNANQPATIPLSACDVLAEPTVVRQDTENIVSIVDVTWLEQTLDDGGLPAPTERHVVVSDAPALDAYGTRRLGKSTELTLETNAATVANDTLTRSRAAPWLIPSFVWDTSTGAGGADIGSLFSLLDGSTRIAAPLAVSELPEWSPIGESMVCWIEGGQYTYDGYWELTMAVAPATSGGQSVNWNGLKVSSLNAYGWNVYDPEIDWRDLVGVGSPPPA